MSIGDFADVTVDGPFTLVYIVFTTFFGLPSQEEQVCCFRNVAARMVPGGTFVIEALVRTLPASVEVATWNACASRPTWSCWGLPGMTP